MATSFENLSAADKADFQKRLAIFGLDTSAILQSDLVVPARSKLTLSAASPQSFLRPHMLTTNDLDELKQWIGIPNQHFESGLLTSHLPVPAPLIGKTLQLPPAATSASAITGRAELFTAPAVGKLASRDLDNVRTAAIAYIWGHSAPVGSYKSVIQSVFPNLQIIVWPFITITVSAGSTLVLGPGQNVLAAWQIIIEPGGTVFGTGGLNVQCSILQGPPSLGGGVAGSGGAGGGGGGGGLPPPHGVAHE